VACFISSSVAVQAFPVLSSFAPFIRYLSRYAKNCLCYDMLCYATVKERPIMFITMTTKYMLIRGFSRLGSLHIRQLKAFFPL